MPRPPATVVLNREALRVLREKDGHTLTSLATASGYSLSYLNDLEKGRRIGNPQVIRKLALVLNVPLSMLESRRVTGLPASAEGAA